MDRLALHLLRSMEERRALFVAEAFARAALDQVPPVVVVDPARAVEGRRLGLHVVLARP